MSLVLFRCLFAICILRKPFGELPSGLIQLPELPLLGRFSLHRGKLSISHRHCQDGVHIPAVTMTDKLK